MASLSSKFLARIAYPRFASHPSNPVAGYVYFNTTDSKLYLYTGSAWQQLYSEEV